MDDTPASKAGIKPGDIITALNGKSVQWLSLKDAVEQMRGAPNSKVTLTIKREGVDQAAGNIDAARGYPPPGGEAADGA